MCIVPIGKCQKEAIYKQSKSNVLQPADLILPTDKTEYSDRMESKDADVSDPIDSVPKKEQPPVYCGIYNHLVVAKVPNGARGTLGVIY